MTDEKYKENQNLHLLNYHLQVDWYLKMGRKCDFSYQKKTSSARVVDLK